jgi:hypothetical protein
MAIIVQIDSVDHTDDVDRPPGCESFRVTMALGSTWECSLATADNNSTIAAYRPALDDNLAILTAPTTAGFFGRISNVRDAPKAGTGTGTRTEVSARAFASRVDQIVVNETFAAGETFEDVVTTLHTNYLNGLGITLDTLATGPTLEAQVYVDVTLRQVLNHISSITGYIWRIIPLYSTFGQLQFFAPGTKTASYSLTAANALSVGPITWEQSREQYFNTVTVRYGTATVVNKTDTFTGTAAAGEVNFPLTYPALLNAGGEVISQGYVTEAGAFLPINGAVWTFDAANNRIVRASDLGTGTVATFNYSVQFPQTVTVSDSSEITAHGTYAIVIDEPDIFDLDAATEAATGYLRRGIVAPMRVSITTRQQALVFPGDTITLTFANRGISGDHLITAVEYTDIALDQSLEYRLTCVSGDEPNTLWRDLVRESLTGGGGASSGFVSGGVIPNTSGRFDEDVVAHAGTADEEVIVGVVPVSGSYLGGPGIVINRNPDTAGGSGSWAIISDQVSGDKGLLFQDRGQTAVGTHTITMIPLGTNTYAFRPATGVSWTLGGSTNLFAALYTSAQYLQGPEFRYGAGVISPSQITADQNNYNPTSLATARVLRLSTDASRTITGIAAGSAGQTMLVVNGGSFPLVLAHNSGSSSAANRIICPNEQLCTLHAGDSVELWYDSAVSLWRVMAAVAPSGPIRPAFSAGDFTASAGSWTVDSGDVGDYSYILTDKMMTVWFSIITTDVSSAGAILRIAVPGGFTIASGVNCQNLIRVSDAGAAAAAGVCYAQGGVAYLQLYADLASTGFASTTGDNTSVIGQISFPIA